MANCPKCNYHLKITDWRQHCPKCKANIVVYDLQERLMQEADIAEVQHYHFQKKIDRVKTSFIGSKIAIVRIFTSLLPICLIFLPLVKVNLNHPFSVATNKGISIITVVNAASVLNADTFNVLMQSNKNATILLATSVLLFFISLVLAFLHFFLNALSCSPKGKPRNYTIDILMIVFAVASVITFGFVKHESILGYVFIGGYLYVLSTIVCFIIDILFFKQGWNIVHKQCYVGGIPIEEYFQMVEDGMTTAEIREIQYEHLCAIQKENEEKLKKEKEVVSNE